MAWSSLSIDTPSSDSGRSSRNWSSSRVLGTCSRSRGNWWRSRGSRRSGSPVTWPRPPSRPVSDGRVTMVRGRTLSVDQPTGRELIHEIRNLARPLRDPADLDPLIQRIGDARVVLLGEASHGTREFYTWRTAISTRLIEEKGFSFIAVEGDWPDCYRVNRFAKGYRGAPDKPEAALETFRRWPR